MICACPAVPDLVGPRASRITMLDRVGGRVLVHHRPGHYLFRPLLSEKSWFWGIAVTRIGRAWDAIQTRQTVPMVK